MSEVDNQNELDFNDPGDINPYIRQSLFLQTHVWHSVEATDKFEPIYTLERAIAYVKNGVPLPGATIMKYDHNKVEPYLHYFRKPYTFNYTPLNIKFNQIILPADKAKEVIDFANENGLSDYLDLIWYLLIRLQIVYTQRIYFGTVGDKEYTDLIYKVREDHRVLSELVERYINKNQSRDPEYLTLTIKQRVGNYIIKDQFFLHQMLECFINEWLRDENGRLLQNWKEKIANFDSSHELKEELENIHRNFSIAFYSFLKCESLVTADIKLSNKYLNPITKMLDLSSYPFEGWPLINKNIQSLLKNVVLP